MFVTLPNPTDLPKSVAPHVVAYNEAASRLAGHQFEFGEATSQRAIDEARASDEAVMAEALEAGADVTLVGTPHETRRRALADAHSRAAATATQLLYDSAVALAAALAEQREAIVEHQRKRVASAATKYAAAVEAMLEVRTAHNIATDLLAWSFSIDGSRDLPNFGSDGTAPLIGEYNVVPESTLVALLRTDAHRAQELEASEARALHQAAENARAEAANRRDFATPIVTAS